MLEELNTFCERGVPQHDHVLRQVLYERQETALGVEPRVCAQFLLVRLQTFDHPRYAELIVALRAV